MCVGQRPAAIVSPHAGTTRDVLESALDICGYPVILRCCRDIILMRVYECTLWNTKLWMCSSGVKMYGIFYDGY